MPLFKNIYYINLLKNLYLQITLIKLYYVNNIGLYCVYYRYSQSCFVVKSSYRNACYVSISHQVILNHRKELSLWQRCFLCDFSIKPIYHLRIFLTCQHMKSPYLSVKEIKPAKNATKAQRTETLTLLDQAYKTMLWCDSSSVKGDNSNFQTQASKALSPKSDVVSFVTNQVRKH